MKKQNLKLNSLKVQSFILPNEKKDKVKGGCYSHGCYSDNYTCNGGPC